MFNRYLCQTVYFEKQDKGKTVIAVSTKHDRSTGEAVKQKENAGSKQKAQSCCLLRDVIDYLQ